MAPEVGGTPKVVGITPIADAGTPKANSVTSSYSGYTVRLGSAFQQNPSKCLSAEYKKKLWSFKAKFNA